MNYLDYENLLIKMRTTNIIASIISIIAIIILLILNYIMKDKTNKPKYFKLLFVPSTIMLIDAVFMNACRSVAFLFVVNIVILVASIYAFFVLLVFYLMDLILSVSRNRIERDYKENLKQKSVKTIKCSCGAENDVSALYCSKCGKKLIENKLVCPNCNSIVNDNDIFCSKCGTKVKKENE